MYTKISGIIGLTDDGKIDCPPSLLRIAPAVTNEIEEAFLAKLSDCDFDQRRFVRSIRRNFSRRVADFYDNLARERSGADCSRREIYAVIVLAVLRATARLAARTNHAQSPQLGLAVYWTLCALEELRDGALIEARPQDWQSCVIRRRRRSCEEDEYVSLVGSALLRLPDPLGYCRRGRQPSDGLNRLCARVHLEVEVVLDYLAALFVCED